MGQIREMNNERQEGERMKNTVHNSLRIVNVLGSWTAKNKVDPIEMMIATTALTEILKKQYVRAVAEDHAKMHSLPPFEQELIKNVLDHVVKDVFGPNVSAREGNMDEIKESIDRTVKEGSDIVQKMIDNDVIHAKIERLLKRYS